MVLCATVLGTGKKSFYHKQALNAPSAPPRTEGQAGDRALLHCSQ